MVCFDLSHEVVLSLGSDTSEKMVKGQNAERPDN